MSDYQSIEWKIRAAMILHRDGFKCSLCGEEWSLHVHHKKYDKRFYAWEYEDDILITVCNVCHMKIHANEPIGNFYLTDRKLKKWKFPADVKRAFKKMGVILR